MIDPTEQFGANVRRARVRRGLSQQRLAARSRLHRTEISLLERGREPRLSTIVRLARSLEVPLTALFEGIE